jgi:ubiquinone/menaquinone biosynthesis C-methylase UbiE
MEGYGPNTYGDRFADVYDGWYHDVTDVDATVARVVALASSGPAGGPVLELGAGSGRLAVPLAEAGLNVWAIDASDAMLDRLRAKPGGDRVHTVVGDMAELDLGPDAPEGFAVVLCAFNTLFNLTDAAAQVRCLSRVAQVLSPRGRLLVEAFVPPPDDAGGPVAAVEPRHIGLDEVVLTVSRLDPATRTITGQHLQITERGVRLRPWVLHYATPAELDEMAAGEGLRLVERHAGWEGEPFTPGSDVHVSCYTPGTADRDASR